jgi:hypothetical protein
VLPTIYGSAMNRGGTVFVNDNIKHFFESVQSVTGATDINCVSIDYNFNRYVFGCDNGYIVRCDFNFTNIVIKQLLFSGVSIGNITNIGQSLWFSDRNSYRVSTAEKSYTCIPSNADWDNIDTYVLNDDKNPEIFFDIIAITNQTSIVNRGQIATFDGQKLRFLRIQVAGTYVVEDTYDVSDNVTTDFAGFYIDNNNFVLRNEQNLFWYNNGNVISLGVVAGFVVGARLQDNNICIYVYKEIDSKYCVCGEIYNDNGEFVEQKIFAQCDSDYGINNVIYVNNRLLCVGSTKSICVYRSTTFMLDFVVDCLDYKINFTNGEIVLCSGGDDVNVVNSYIYNNINTKRVLVPFKVNKLINYVLEFGNNVIRFYKNRQLVVDGNGDPYEVSSPYSISDLIDDEGKIRINYMQNVDVLYICHEDYPIQVLKRYGDANWIIEDFTLVGGPFGDTNTDKNKTLVSTQTEGLITINAVNNSSSLTMNNNAGDVTTASFKNLLAWYLDGNSIYFATLDHFPSIQEAVNALLGTSDGTNFIVTYSGNTINITVKTSAGTSYNGKVLRLLRYEFMSHYASQIEYVREYDSSATFSASSTPVNVFSEDMVGKLIRLNYTDTNTHMWETGKSISIGNIRKSGNNYYKAVSGGTTGQVKPVHTSGSVSDGGVTWLYLHSGYGVGTILEFVSQSQIKVNADGYFPDFTYGTYLWELGIVGNGIYPNCCALFKERFVFSISTANGTKICTSCAGDYNNFSDNSFGDILAENAITVLLQGQQESSVLWMHALNKLYIGTACEEFVFGEQTIAEVLSPTNVMCLKVSSLGSAAIEPLQILDELFFVSNNEKQIANFTYIAERDSFRPTNISVMFEHLLHDGVKCWAYTKEPYKTIWFADREGVLKSISYDADNKVCAGARHDVGGKVISLTVIPESNGNYDDLWMVVERVVAGQTVYYTERLSWGLPQENVSDDYKNKHGVFCDCAKLFEFENNVEEVSGLYFLEGKTVKVVVDGKVQTDKTVVDGTITLDEAGKIVVVGIGYDWLIETLFFNIGANDGTAQALPQRVSKLIARCINTRYIKAKATGGNQYDVIANESDLTDDDYEIHLPSDYSRKMTIFFTSDKPLSACILCIVAEMQTYQ